MLPVTSEGLEGQWRGLRFLRPAFQARLNKDVRALFAYSPVVRVRVIYDFLDGNKYRTYSFCSFVIRIEQNFGKRLRPSAWFLSASYAY